MDTGADSSPPPPRSDRETPADALWPESSKAKGLQFTDLNRKIWITNMEQTRSNTRKILMWNKLYPHQTPSPAAGDSYSGLSWPQEDNAGAPSERYQSSSNNSPSPAHHTLALHASGHLSGSISSCLLLSAYNAEQNHE